MEQEIKLQTPHHSKNLLIPAILVGGLLIGGLVGYFLGAAQGYKAGYQAYGIQLEQSRKQGVQESQMSPTPLPYSAPRAYTTLETKGVWALRVQPKPEIPGGIFEEVTLLNSQTQEQRVLGNISVYAASGVKFTPDGTKVVIVNGYDQNPGDIPAISIYSISDSKFIKQVPRSELDKTGVTLNIHVGDLGYLAISPNGTKLAFSSVRNPLEPSLYDDILVYNTTTDKTIKLSETGHPKSWIDNNTLQYETIDTSNKEPGFPKPTIKQVLVN